jgi:hypothetical protein
MPKQVPATIGSPETPYNSKKAAGELGVSNATFYAGGHADAIESYRIGNLRFWLPSKVREYRETLTVPAIKPSNRRGRRPVRRKHAPNQPAANT